MADKASGTITYIPPIIEIVKEVAKEPVVETPKVEIVTVKEEIKIEVQPQVTAPIAQPEPVKSPEKEIVIKEVIKEVIKTVYVQPPPPPKQVSDVPMIPTDDKRDTVAVMVGQNGKKYEIVRVDEKGNIGISGIDKLEKLMSEILNELRQGKKKVKK